MTAREIIEGLLPFAERALANAISKSNAGKLAFGADNMPPSFVEAEKALTAKIETARSYLVGPVESAETAAEAVRLSAVREGELMKALRGIAGTPGVAAEVRAFANRVIADHQEALKRDLSTSKAG